jgi:ribosome-binding factor A
MTRRRKFHPARVPGETPLTGGASATRKAQQLCRQVAETLSQVLSGECADSVLQGLQVLAVDPAPSSRQLLVTVAGEAGRPVNAAEIRERLDAASPWLSCQVAAAVTRKRAPRLAWLVVPPPSRDAHGRSS